MQLPDLPSLFAECRESVPQFAPPMLAAFFRLPVHHFTQRQPSGPTVFVEAGLTDEVAYGLHGTIFLPSKRIVRGLGAHPPLSDHTREPYAAHRERAFCDAWMEGDATVEVVESAVAIRMYEHEGRLAFATDYDHDGASPLLGMGVDNARGLGITCSSQASRLAQTSVGKAARLAALGYVLCFAMTLPEREAYVPAERPELILTDVIDPDHYFVDRLEKERIAEDYGLNVNELQSRRGPVRDARDFYAQLRALEHLALQNDVAGYVVKARSDAGDQITIPLEPSAARLWDVPCSPSDIADAYACARESLAPGQTPPSAAFVEELMLMYLGTTRRAVRWQAREYIEGLIPG